MKKPMNHSIQIASHRPVPWPSVLAATIGLLLTSLLIAGCDGGGGGGVDMGPVGDGLTFLGLAIVLAVLLGIIATFFIKWGNKP